MKRKKYNNIFQPLKKRQLTTVCLAYGMKRLPLETDNQLRKRSILFIMKHKPGFLNREEYKLITNTTYYRLWKINKSFRQLKNIIIQEIKNVIKRL